MLAASFTRTPWAEAGNGGEVGDGGSVVVGELGSLINPDHVFLRHAFPPVYCPTQLPRPKEGTEAFCLFFPFPLDASEPSVKVTRAGNFPLAGSCLTDLLLLLSGIPWDALGTQYELMAQPKDLLNSRPAGFLFPTQLHSLNSGSQNILAPVSSFFYNF